MVPDPNPADSRSVNSRDPAKLSAADQMCTVDGDVDSRPALYNHDKCGRKGIPNPRDPKSEVRPFGLKQGEIANNTVIVYDHCVSYAIDSFSRCTGYICAR